ncbi:hypothetical protein [Dyadobacter tibetensis]|uniref:hypothetical protein n=1 Tax=Dyadobacter tibetensis TaxID=1211851 RepID=UPI000471BDB8|nr:hypothetical protein [Dyadobacter tibetensis]
MKPSEKNNFEAQWKRALEDASVPPPKSVWDGIETRLDEEDRKIIPLAWWQTPRLLLVAASIAALLVVGGGVWYNSLEPDVVGHDIALQNNDAKRIEQPSTSISSEAVPQAPADRTDTQAETSNKDSFPTSAITNVPQPEQALARHTPTAEQVPQALLDKNLADRRLNTKNPGRTVPDDLQAGRSSLALGEKGSSGNAMQRLAGESPMANQQRGDALLAQNQRVLEASMLEIRPAKEAEVLMQKRYVFFKPDMPDEPILLASSGREYYAGISFMPASFNPNLKVVSAPESYRSMSYASQSAVTGGSKSGASYAFQTQGGVKLSKHWSVEMGISYLQGNSVYEGGGYLLNAASTNLSANVVESAIADVSKSSGDKVYNSPNHTLTMENTNKMYINISKDISNNYRYMQLPLQAGYTLNPEGKWNYAILGGVMTNFFLSNELESSTGSVITTKASDQVYRSVNLAATTGLRIQYQLSEKWRANLTGSYQQSLTPGLHSHVSLQSKPNLYGIGWGVRYSF